MKSILTTLTLSACAALAVMPASAQDSSFIRTAAAQNFETDFTQAADKSINSVVCIKSYVNRRQQQYYDPFGGIDPFEFFFGTPQQRQQPRGGNRQRQNDTEAEPVQSGLGSGVILSSDGYIVTNNHVVADADKLEVLLNDNNTYEATIIGTDEATDLALIKINANGLDAIEFGSSDALKIGEWVLAVGNPFGFNSTVTAGIVSAKARSISSGTGATQRLGLDSYIQTDAALNPGNSGGALVNLKGQLVGINAAIYSNTGSYTGFSFAIPETVVKKIVTDLKQYGTVQRAVLGIRYQELNSKLAKEKNIEGVVAGIYVAKVEDRSTAKEMGLEEGDVITAINGNEIHTGAQLTEQMNRFRPGEAINITYYRDGKRSTAKGTLRNDRGNTEITKKEDFSSLGCTFMALSADTKKSLGVSHGVQVKGLKNGLFKEQGIRDGFVILYINDVAVSNADDVENLYNQIMRNGDGEKVMFITGVYPTGGKKYYAVDLSAQ